MDPNPFNERVRNWALTSQAVVTMIAVSVGGWFAWRNRHLFRFGQPHLTISHEITHRRVSPGYVQVTVTAILHNTSRVKVEIRDGLFVIQLMAPISDTEAEEIYAKTFRDTLPNRTLIDHGALKWETLDDVRLTWNEEELIAEPGESATATFEYIVDSEVESLLITTYFYNSKATGKIDNHINPKDAGKKKHWLVWKQSGRENCETPKAENRLRHSTDQRLIPFSQNKAPAGDSVGAFYVVDLYAGTAPYSLQTPLDLGDTPVSLPFNPRGYAVQESSATQSQLLIAFPC